MAIQRVEVATSDALGTLTKTAAGTVSAGHVLRVEYDDTKTTAELYEALRKLADDIQRLEQ